jgi:type I restriction enzyme S subunit
VILEGKEIGSNKLRVHPNVVLLCKINPRINRVWLVGDHSPWPKIASTEWIPFYPVSGIYQPYLAYYMQQSSFRDFLSMRASGVGGSLMRVKPSTFTDYPFLVAPFPEQRRIVDAIETQFTRLDAAVAALERTQANLARYRASVLQAACEGRLVPTEAELARREGRDYEPADELLARILEERRAKWEEERWEYEIERAKKKAAQAERKAAGLPYYIRDLEPEHWEHRTREEYERYLPKSDKWKEKYDEPEPPDTEGLPELPEGWVWAAMPQIGELGRGRSRHRPRNDERLFGGPYPFVQTGEVRAAEGTITKYTQTYNELGLSQSKLWPKGTLCITIAANIAETAILGFDGCFPDSIVGFVPEQGAVARFFDYYLRTVQKRLESKAPATAQKNINLTTLSELAVPLPPFAEQRRIVEEVERRLSVVEALERSVESNLTRAQRLRQAILKKAFEGRLVDRDRNDELASALSGRFAAQQAAE